MTSAWAPAGVLCEDFTKNMSSPPLPLCSGDVGLGLNARRLREGFTKNFTVTYSLRPIDDVGSVYRRYPEMWKVFLEEEGMPGRYKLIAEKPSRPAGVFNREEETFDFEASELCRSPLMHVPSPAA